MTKKRYMQLNGAVDHKLTDAEIKQGWHFCYEFDGLCRNSNEEDFKCDCNEFQIPAIIYPKDLDATPTPPHKSTPGMK
jgi:hypothetical protein